MKIQSILCIVVFGLLCCEAARMIRTTGEVIPNQFIVGFRGNLLRNQRLQHINQVRQMISRYGGFNINHVYELPDWSGYSITASTSVINYILSSPLVEYVEEDQILRTHVCQQEAAPPSWGLDRIDARALPLNQQYNYNADTQGTGVTAYVIDTGIDITHPDFEGRAVWGYTAIDNATNTDCNGHGTHVAGTIGSKTYGVAKKVTLVAVKVLNCDGSGSISDIVEGITWVTNHASNPRKSVANMSLGGGQSTSLNNAVSSAITAGFLFSVAAGNNNQDACNQSPASVGSALTVGATTSNDARASYSNWGRCVDLFAPGSNIVSTWPNNSNRTLSGTSMAAPHATGVAALMRSANTSVTASTVVSQGVSNVVNLSCGFLNFGCSRQTTRTMLYTGSCQ